MPVSEVRAFRDAKGAIPIQAWLNDLQGNKPKAYHKCLARILELEEQGSAMRRPHADYLQEAIHELRASLSGIHYRILYFFSGQNAVVLSHGLTKEKTVPQRDIDLAVSRMNLVLKSPEKHTATFNI
jgi:phage-related protein